MRFAIPFALTLLAGCATFTISEDHFFHPGPAVDPAPVTAPGAREEVVSWTASDGTRLGASYVAVPDADVEILYFGGDSFRIDDFGGELASILTPLRANVFMIDYRGYGRSAGVPTVEALKSDALAAFDHLRQRSPHRPIVVHGFSLGSFMAAHVGAHRPVAGLVLESSAPDVSEWAKAQVPAYAKATVRLKIAPTLVAESNIQRIAAYRGPLLVLTGSADGITPPRFAEALFNTSPSPDKRIFIVPGAKHGNVLLFAGAVEEYRSFLRRVRAAS